MLTITIKVDALSEDAQGVKECLAMYLEQFGRAEVVEVKAPVPWQDTLFGYCPRDHAATRSARAGNRKGVRR